MSVQRRQVFPPHRNAPDEQFALDVGHIRYHQGTVRVIDESSRLYWKTGTIPNRRGFRVDDEGIAIYNVTFAGPGGKVFIQEMTHDQLYSVPPS